MITQIKEQFDRDMETLDSVDMLAPLEIRYLGRSGLINEVFRTMKDLSPVQKRQLGEQINELKHYIEDTFVTKKEELLVRQDEESVTDVTLPGVKYPHGNLHMTTYAIEEITSIFAKIGFMRMTYPEVEYEYFSFDALNIAADHPARDDFETFFVDAPPHGTHGKMVLTPHTSSGQIREMLRLQSTPPIRMINIGKTYRPNWDASHVPMFHQFEGMCVDFGITISHLKGTIEYFAREFFGPDREIRLRPFHFQFTEPSFEIDISCGVCGGSGIVGNQKCKICKQGWLELGGSGMVHPNILRSGGINPAKYTGWAFGFGVERVMAMKEGLKLDDIRILYNGDIRFLEQF